MPALSHEDALGFARVAVLPEHPGRLLVRARVKHCLAAQPGAPGGLDPRSASAGRPGVSEAVVGQASDGEALRPGRRIVSEERGGRIGEVHARRDCLPTQVQASAHGRRYRLNRVPVLVACRGSGACKRPAGELQPALDGAPVEYHQSGRGESVSQPDGSFDDGLVEADRVSAWVVQRPGDSRRRVGPHARHPRAASIRDRRGARRRPPARDSCASAAGMPLMN
jgi:hypothetical protein